MGNLKEEALKTGNEDIQQHKLTDQEMNYVRLLNIALQYHTLGQQILSNFLYYVCVNRLGYKDPVNLQFELDFNKNDNILTVKLLPEPATPANITPDTPTEQPPAGPAAA